MKTKGIILGGAGILAVAGAVIFSSFLRKDEPPSAGAGAPERHGSEDRTVRSSRWQPLTDPSLTRQQRLEVTRTIRPGLSETDVNMLFTLLHHVPSPEDASMWWLVANQIMEEMRKNGVGAADYTDRLSALALDPAAGEVIRDYAIQHLGQWIAPALPGSMPGEPDPAAQLRGIHAITSAIKDASLASTSIPGTGLLTLADMDSRMNDGEKAAVRESLSGFLSEVITGKRQTSVILRASAVQYVSRTGQRAFRADIRRLAETGGEGPSLRLSSIHALGVFADPSDRVFLEQLSSLDSPFQYAARFALKQNSSPSQP